MLENLGNPAQVRRLKIQFCHWCMYCFKIVFVFGYYGISETRYKEEALCESSISPKVLLVAKIAE